MLKTNIKREFTGMFSFVHFNRLNCFVPNNKLLGYYQMSLRDSMEIAHRFIYGKPATCKDYQALQYQIYLIGAKKLLHFC